MIVRKKRKGDVLIFGHTDSKGSESYNHKLSERRAEAVKDRLARKGNIDPSVMKTKGFGELKPVALNTLPDGADNPEGQAKNGPVEIIIRPAETAQ